MRHSTNGEIGTALIGIGSLLIALAALIWYLA
ncbi:MAG: hypothetical protein JWQ77_590 [Jatrophihabitans sp.]|nr:hypothetical protein [Jatrophihabitans sp.]